MDAEYAARLAAAAQASDSPRASSHPSPLASPRESPRRPARPDRYGDRFIPVRAPSFPAETTVREDRDARDVNGENRDDPAKVTYNMLLRNEVLGASLTSPSVDRSSADHVLRVRERAMAC